MKPRTGDAAGEDKASTLRRSSRRKPGPDDGAKDLDHSLSSAKSSKQPGTGASKWAVKHQEQTIRPNKSTAVDGRKERSDHKAATTASEKTRDVKTQTSSLAAKDRLTIGTTARSPTRKRKANETVTVSSDIKGRSGTKHPNEIGAKAPQERGQKQEIPVDEAEEKDRQDTGLADDTADPSVTNTTKKVKRKRQTADEKASEAMPLALRTPNLRMYVGAHVSMAKGIENSVMNSHHIGGNAFALFLKSQRKWDNPALLDTNRDAFHANCHAHKYNATSHILPHGPYLVNLAVEDSERAKQAYESFLDDLRRCEALGIRLYNFHPGAANKSPLPEAIQRLSAKLNSALAATETVTPLLENMAGSGSVIGSRFSELRDVITQIKPEFQSRIGVCIDTCHAYAAGYDLRSPKSYQDVLQEFDDVVGLKFLKALHLNDSKAPLGSKKDLHQNIGLGFLGLRAFHNVMNDKRLEGLPLILETPCDKKDLGDPSGKKVVEDKGIWAKEIKMLESLIGMDAESKDFKALEAELAERGRSEREQMLKSINEREKKKLRKEERGTGKPAGQKTLLQSMKGTSKTEGKKRGKGNVKEATESESSALDSPDKTN